MTGILGSYGSGVAMAEVGRGAVAVDAVRTAATGEVMRSAGSWGATPDTGTSEAAALDEAVEAWSKPGDMAGI